MSFWDKKEAKRPFKKLPFCNIFIEKPHVKHLINVVVLHERPFYDELTIKKLSEVYKSYARSCGIEKIDS